MTIYIEPPPRKKLRLWRDLALVVVGASAVLAVMLMREFREPPVAEGPYRKAEVAECRQVKVKR